MLDTTAELALLLVLAWLVANAAIAVVHRHDLARILREPVLARPVLVVESDDWGAGPAWQAPALQRIAEVLALHRDATGRTALLNLALVLAVPDGPAIAAAGAYQRVALDDPRFADILAALRDGAARGVFALQLHGLEHYWPPTLMASADPGVNHWLRQSVPAATEQLPAPLQSRWVDAGRLPSTPHAASAVDAAVADEVDAFARIVGSPPRVVVPPTFVWTREVERAWVRQGVECLVTPGRRSTCRDAAGLPAGDEGPIANGDRSEELSCIVRFDYFEPIRGRDAAHALRALDRAVREGRPCVLENHRDNFDGDRADAALAELDTLLGQALRQRPGLRFLSTHELCRILRDRDPQWVATDIAKRLSAWRVRLAGCARAWKLLRLTGAAALIGALAGLVSRRPAPDATPGA
ncbi:MAG: hypothetical protein HYZ20_03080 [Burkholderiales bacterium]|nr:hypothetical protein [Burkholderiales bacterium]